VGALASAHHALPRGACLPRHGTCSCSCGPACSIPKRADRAGGLLIPLSVPEVHRLLLSLDAAAEARAFRLGWSRGRRAHQAVAQCCHSARRTRERAARPLEMPLPAPIHGALTDTEWERVQAVLPPQRPRTGRPNHDHRTVLSGILWVLRTLARNARLLRPLEHGLCALSPLVPAGGLAADHGCPRFQRATVATTTLCRP